MALTLKQHLKLAKSLTQMLDTQFCILGFRFGLDSVFDLVPGVGTILPTVLSFYLVWIGWEFQIPKPKLYQMMTNIFIDSVIGSIPFLGAFVDAFFKANVKNLSILENALN